jgi:hypothetical protein
VFEHTAKEIIRDADIQCAANPAGKDVDEVALLHGRYCVFPDLQPSNTAVLPANAGIQYGQVPAIKLDRIFSCLFYNLLATLAITGCPPSRA